MIDFLMTISLLLLMSYSLIGEAVHEWVGMGMFLLFILHLVLNRKWIGSFRKGKYSAYRILQTVVAVLCFLLMIGAMGSGIVLSQHLFSALRIRGLRSAARAVHMVCSFWGFAFMSLHLGLHWNMLLGAASRFPVVKAPLFRFLGWMTAIYGVYAFWERGFPGYLFFQTHFLFLDYEEPAIAFFADYLAVMGLFIFCAHYGVRLLTHRKNKLGKEDAFDE